MCASDVGYKLTTAPVLEEHTSKALRSAYMLDLMVRECHVHDGAGLYSNSSSLLLHTCACVLQDLALYIVETDGRADMFNTRVDHIANSMPIPPARLDHEGKLIHRFMGRGQEGGRDRRTVRPQRCYVRGGIPIFASTQARARC